MFTKEIYNLAEPGDRVLCINTDLPTIFDEWSSARLVAGIIYTASRTVLAPHYQTGELVMSYQLEELTDGEVEPDTIFFAASKIELVKDD